MARKKDLVEALREAGALSPKDAESVLKEMRSQQKSAEEILHQLGLVADSVVAQTKADLFNLPVKFFEKDEVIPREVLSIIPEESARQYSLLSFARDYDTLYVGMLHPDDVRAQEALKFIAQKLNLTVRIFIVTLPDLHRFWKTYRTLGEEMARALQALQKQYPATDVAATGRPLIRLDEAAISAMREEAPIIQIVALLLKEAVSLRASDVHIEPQRTHLRIRYRIDGDLQERIMLPLSVQSPIVSRVKIMANLKIDETRVPQDGRFRTIIDQREIDFRVSTFPTAAGEKAAIRILDPATGLKGLAELGFSNWNLEIIKEGIEKPFGMILATGPTGSGKTTTLYAILQILNQVGTNIVTLEDPIEYFIDGLNQSQVLPEIGYTFATGLRQIVRQDPDIIMVGEIRDTETAELAVHAALTGHLVLSTLHTNNAIGVVPRLVDLGVQPFLLPATLNLMLSQRLVRRLCPDCKKPVAAEARLEKVIEMALNELPKVVREKLPYQKPYTIYMPQGCETCNHKGTLGRIGVHEILKMTPELERSILSGISEASLKAEARRQEMMTMRQEGVLKALEGIVSLQEVIQETS